MHSKVDANHCHAGEFQALKRLCVAAREPSTFAQKAVFG